MLKRNTTRFNTGISLRDALADYLRSLPDTDERARCSATDPLWSNIKGIGARGPYDYSGVTCLTPAIQAHDGRIKPTVR
mgnify:FL=1